MSSSFELNIKKNIFFDEGSIEKPEPITKKKQKTFKELKKVALNQIHKRYGPKAKLKYSYKGLIMENLIFNKNTHLVSVFKDYMIWDYIEEFLKRFYKGEESNERVPKFASFYKNYLKFFCVPTFKDIFCNEMIHNYSEKKAELFYNENYKSKKEKNSFQEDYGVLEESESDEESETSNANNNIEKTIFNETVKKKIEKYSPINTSMALPESDTKLKPDDSGLLITSSNETSLVNIMKGMTSPLPKGIPKSKKSENTAKEKENKNNNSKNKAHKTENSNSYRMNQRNLIHSSLNKFNSSKTLETLLNSQMKNRNNRNKNIIHYNNYSNLAQRNHTNRINSKDNNHANSNNMLVKNNLQNKNMNKNKIMSYNKKKSVPKSRNEDKSPEEIVKSQTQINNYINGSINSNNNLNNNNNNNIDNLKNNKINLNINQLGTTLSTRTKNITSINNYNLNYKQSIQKGRNQQQSISINSNTYSKYSFDRINNVKKKINLFKNNNIEYILNQLKFRPFCTLKKNSKRKVAQSNSNRNKKEEKRSTKKTTELNINNNKERNSAKIRSINGRNNNNDISPNNKKAKFQNSPSALDFLKKTSEYIRNMNGKGSYNKDIKITKKSERNCSYNEWQKSYAEDKINNNNKNKNVNIINNKIPFEGILSNANNNKKSRTLNNNGSKHIHNVNININNQINIGGKQFHELFSFSDLVKKNSVNTNIKNLFSLTRNKDKKPNYISRNKNQSLDFNSYTNNQMNSVGSNKMNSIGEAHNNNIYKTQYKINIRKFNGSNNIKNKNGNKKIRLTNNALFRSMRIINNNNNYIHNNKLRKPK